MVHVNSGTGSLTYTVSPLLNLISVIADTIRDISFFFRVILYFDLCLTEIEITHTHIHTQSLTCHTLVTTGLLPLSPGIRQLVTQRVLWLGWEILRVVLGEGFGVGSEVRVDVRGRLWGSVDRG